MKKYLLLIATLLTAAIGTWANNTHPIDTYVAPRVSGETAPAAEGNALIDGLHAPVANRDAHYQLLGLPQHLEQ